MIKIFNNFTDLVFPVTTCKKYKKLESTQEQLILGDSVLVKHGNLFNTFHLALTNLPETYVTFGIPELLLMNIDSLYKKVIIDDKLNIFIPNKKIKVILSTFEALQINQLKGYILVKEIPYPIPLAKAKEGLYVLLACVNGLYFHAGWSSKREDYEIFI